LQQGENRGHAGALSWLNLGLDATAVIWDYDFELASNVVDVYVSHLRNKVDPPDGP